MSALLLPTFFDIYSNLSRISHIIRKLLNSFHYLRRRMSSGDIESVTKQLAETSVAAKSVLSFSKRGLKLDSPEHAKEIIDALDNSKNVQTFELVGNTLGVTAAKVIGQALEKHPEFKNALWSDLFTGRLKAEIPEALIYLGDGIRKSGAGLVELDLSDNAFGPNGMKGLVDLLQSESCYTLQILRLHNNGLGTTGGKMLAECLLECHKRSVAAGKPLALRVFQSGRGRLENEGSIALAEAFKAMGSLEEVVMPQNGIYHQGIAALAEAFKSNKNLKHINLQDNTFTDKGAESMAKALKHLPNLETINFGDCLLRTRGAKILARSLSRGHHKLKSVSLCFNEIAMSGATAVAESMVGKENLEVLELDGNALGEDGVESLRTIMGDLGLQDQLGSLSEDEGTADEDDQDDVVDISDDSGGEEENGLGDQTETPTKNKIISAADFLLFPSPTKLRELGPNRGRAMVDHLGSSINDVDKAVNTVMRTCSVVTTDDNQIKQEACECADAILSRVFSSSDDNTTSAVTNAILVNLGLLKSEDKKFKPPANIQGSLIVLEHIVKKKYFPKVAKDVLICFLGRPHPLLDSCVAQKHALFTALHQ